MHVPDPYFKDTPSYGDLWMEEILVDYDYPLLSVLQDDTGSRYLCMCFDTRGSQQWLVTPIADWALADLLQNRIPLAAPFQDRASRKLLVQMDYQTQVDTFLPLDADAVPEEDLPKPGDCLDPDPGEWDAYLAQLGFDQPEC